MKTRAILTLLWLALATMAWAEPRTVTGSSQGPIVVLVTGAEGAVNLWHGDAVVRGWVFPGPFAATFVLATAADKVEWDGAPGTLLPAGKDAAAAARTALAKQTAPRVVYVGADGATQVLKAPEDEVDMDYDAASAATEE